MIFLISGKTLIAIIIIAVILLGVLVVFFQSKKYNDKVSESTDNARKIRIRLSDEQKQLLNQAEEKQEIKEIYADFDHPKIKAIIDNSADFFRYEREEIAAIFRSGDDSAKASTSLKEDEMTFEKLCIKYKRSFMAKIIQSDDLTKHFYKTIKEKLLSYEGIKSRLSWSGETYKVSGNQIAKLTATGKTLKLFLALDPTRHHKSIYTPKDMSSVKKYHQVPFMLKIKSERGLKNALTMIDNLNLGPEINEMKVEVPCEDEISMVRKGYIK